MENYLITGATGLIGSVLIKRLGINNHVVCPVRNIEKAKLMFAECNQDNIKLIEGDIESYLGEITEEFDFIIHCASPTSSRYFIEYPVETLHFGISTTCKILEYARKHNVKSIVYLSSLEVYGTIEGNMLISEEFQGYVNPLNVRSSYNIMKRTCETTCHSYAIEYEVPVKIARLTQTISPDVLESDMRIFAQFARKAANKEDIELHTDGSSARQYIYIDDAINAIMTILFKGKNGDAYNVANEDTFISAKDLAEFVQNNFNPNHKVVYKMRKDMGYAPTTKVKLNTNKLKALGWEPKTNLYEMFDKVINKIRNTI